MSYLQSLFKEERLYVSKIIGDKRICSAFIYCNPEYGHCIHGHPHNFDPESCITVENCELSINEVSSSCVRVEWLREKKIQ